MNPDRALLVVERMSITLAGRPPVEVVGDVSFSVDMGETLGVVGESGSGKSLTMLAVLGLLPPDIAVTAGSVRLGGRELCTLRERERREIRGSEIGMVFQDPMTSLNPVLTIGAQVRESLRRMHLGRNAGGRAAELLGQVGLADPTRCLRRYPHELSGGMRQRVMLAMALAADPRLLILDEPTTALDVTTQAQIVELVGRLRREHNFACIWVSHDLGVIASVADKVMVMYAGHRVESGPVRDIFHAPGHPYTRGLLGSVARLDRPRKLRLAAIPGRPPSLATPPPGCPLSPRCPEAEAACDSAFPPLVSVGPGHEVACLHALSSGLALRTPMATSRDGEP